MADSDVLIQIRGDVADINAKLSDLKGNIGKVTGETKNLSDQSRGILETLKSNWVAASAAIVAAWALVNKAVSYMDQGARAQQIASSFDIVAQESGAYAAEMIDNMKALTKGTVAESDLQQKAVKMLLAGYDPEQIVRFSGVAITASQYMGTSVTESFEKIADSIATRMPSAMVQSGAATREQMQVVTQAMKAGADQALLMDLAIANLAVKQLRLQGTLDLSALAMQRFHTSVKETGETLGGWFITATQKAYGALQGIAGTALIAAGAIIRMIAAQQQQKAAQGTQDDYEKDMVKGNEALKTANDLTAAGDELLKKGTANITGQVEEVKKASKESIDAKKAEVAAIMAKLKAIADAAKGEKDILASLIKEHKAAYETAVSNAQEEGKARIFWAERSVDVEQSTIRTEMAARADQYNADAKSISDKVANHLVKVEKLKALYAEYSRDYTKLFNQLSDNDRATIKADADYQIATWRRLSTERKTTAVTSLEGERSLYDITKQSTILTGAEKLQAEYDFKQRGYAISIALLDSERQRLEVENLFSDKENEIQGVTAAIADIEQKRVNLGKELTAQAAEYTGLGGIKKGLATVYDDYTNMGKQMEAFTKRAFDGMTNAITDFVMTGKANFQDFANSVIKDLVRILIQSQITAPLAGLAGTAIKAGVKAVGTMLFHEGGVVGEDAPFGYRLVPASAFANAPRYHSGIGPGEQAAIIRNDETVLTPGQMKALGAGTGSGTPQVVEHHYHYATNVDMKVTALDSRSVTQTLAQHQSEIIGIINQAYNKMGKRGPMGS